jgi:hypothetical protein
MAATAGVIVASAVWGGAAGLAGAATGFALARLVILRRERQA